MYLTARLLASNISKVQKLMANTAIATPKLATVDKAPDSSGTLEMTLALLFRPALMPYLTVAMPSLTAFSRALVPSVGSVYVAVHSIFFLSLLIFIS